MSGWPKETKYLSKDLQRVDAVEKVTGKAEYAYDVHPKGCLYGQILRSKWPAAKIQSVDLSVAEKMPGVKAVMLVQKVPRVVRYYGQEIAAVAAETTEQAEDAIRAIKVKATPLPFVVNSMDAIQEGAPEVFEGQSNLSKAKTVEKGNIEEGYTFAGANAHRVREIISVKELFDNLEGEYSLAVSEFLNKKVVPDKIAVVTAAGQPLTGGQGDRLH